MTAEEKVLTQIAALVKFAVQHNLSPLQLLQDVASEILLEWPADKHDDEIDTIDMMLDGLHAMSENQ